MTKQVLPKQPPLDIDVPDEPSFKNPTRPDGWIVRRSTSRGKGARKSPGIQRDQHSMNRSEMNMSDYLKPKRFEGSIDELSEVIEADVLLFKTEIAAATSRQKPEASPNMLLATPMFKPVGPPNAKIKMSQGIKSHMHDQEPVIYTDRSVQENHSEIHPPSNSLNRGAIDLEIFASKLSDESLNDSGAKMSKVRNLLGFFFNKNFKKEFAEHRSKMMSEKDIRMPKSTVMKESFVPSPSKSIHMMSRSDLITDRQSEYKRKESGNPSKIFSFPVQYDQAFVEVGSHRQFAPNRSFKDYSDTSSPTETERRHHNSIRLNYYKPLGDPDA